MGILTNNSIWDFYIKITLECIRFWFEMQRGVVTDKFYRGIVEENIRESFESRILLRLITYKFHRGLLMKKFKLQRRHMELNLRGITES